MEIPTIQQLIDAGVEFTEVTREKADAFVKQLVDRGEVQRRDAERVVQELVDRGRETSERIAANVQREVAKQVAIMSERFDELEERFEALTEMLAERVPSASAARSSSGRRRPGRLQRRRPPRRRRLRPRRPPPRRLRRRRPRRRRRGQEGTAKKTRRQEGTGQEARRQEEHGQEEHGEEGIRRRRILRSNGTTATARRRVGPSPAGRQPHRSPDPDRRAPGARQRIGGRQAVAPGVAGRRRRSSTVRRLGSSDGAPRSSIMRCRCSRST